MYEKIKRIKFTEQYKKSFNKNPLFNYNKKECWFSFLFGVGLTCLLYKLYYTSASSIVPTIQNMLLPIVAALIGMLGFIVSGLAIISGTVKSKAADSMNKAGALNSLVSIMFSFYYIGAVIAGLIGLYLISYILISIKDDFIIYLYLALCFILTYGLSFVILYAVSLLGTCINIFLINYSYDSETVNNTPAKEIGNWLDSSRVDALTSLLVKKGITNKQEFIRELELCIERDCPIQLKDEVDKMMRSYYNLTEQDSSYERRKQE